MSQVAQGIPDYPLRYKNSTGAEIPAYGIFKLESGARETTNELVLFAELVAADGNDALYVNSGKAIATDGYGWCRSVGYGPFWAKYDTGSAPTNGAVCGPVAGEVEVAATGTGIVAIFKDTAKGLVLCEKLGGAAPAIRTDPPSFTIAEVDPATGEVIAYMDRGRPRYSLSAGTLTEVDLLYSTDGFLYALGNGWLNKDNGSLIKWNVDTYEIVWYSDQGAFRSPGAQLLATGAIGGAIGNVQKITNHICEASDGMIWTCGATVSTAGGGLGRLAKYDPDTGSQLAEVNIGADAVYAADSIGGVVIVISGSNIRVYDSSGVLTATFSAFGVTVAEIAAGVIVTTDGSTLKTLNADDLTEISSRSVPAGETYIAATTDGTTVWVATSHATVPKYRSYDVANLATEHWNANRDTSSSTTMHLKYANSALYDWAQHVRKINASDGSETWEFTGGAVAPGTRRGCAVTAGFVYANMASVGANIFAADESAGEAVWTDVIAPSGSYVILPTSDGRLFISGPRTDA